MLRVLFTAIFAQRVKSPNNAFVGIKQVRIFGKHARQKLLSSRQPIYLFLFGGVDANHFKNGGGVRIVEPVLLRN